MVLEKLYYKALYFKITAIDRNKSVKPEAITPCFAIKGYSKTL